MKIGVTGAFGFIASHHIEELHEQGHEVVGLVRHFGKYNMTKEHPDTVYMGDLRDKEVVEKFVAQCDAVIHLAGILGTQETVNNPYPSVEVNIIGGLNVLEACRIWKVPMAYVCVGNHWMNNSYSITKTTTERFCQMYAKEHGVRVKAFRILNAYGERQKAYPVRKMLPSFITRALKGQPIQVYGSGDSIMDFVYVKDVAKVITDHLFNWEKSENGKVYEIGLGHGYPVKKLAQLVLDCTGSSSGIEHLPMRPGEDNYSEVVAKDPLPFDYTPFEVGLAKTCQWYKENTK